jgi:hypothetical protein
MRHVQLDSESLASAGYDARRWILEVVFRHGGRYRYFEVPAIVYAGLLRASSAGRYFHHRIRGIYAYERIRGDSARARRAMRGKRSSSARRSSSSL